MLLDHRRLNNHHQAQASSSELTIDRRTVYANINRGLELGLYKNIETGINSTCIRRYPDRHVQMDDVVVDDDQISVTFEGWYHDIVWPDLAFSYKPLQHSYHFELSITPHHARSDSAGNCATLQQSTGLSFIRSPNHQLSIHVAKHSQCNIAIPNQTHDCDCGRSEKPPI